MKALGLVETNGLVAAIEASDVMLKTAEIDLLSKEIVGGGLVTITVVGDVAAVKTSVEAAATAVQTLGSELLLSTHVIPRPDSSLSDLFKESNLNNSSDKEEPEAPQEEIAAVEKISEEAIKEPEAKVEPETEVETTSVEDTSVTGTQGSIEDRLKDTLATEGKEKATQLLNAVKVADLRKEARKLDRFSIPNKDIHRINKERLIKALIDYFDKN